VEFALVALMLATMLASFGDIANLVHVALIANNAAREGARAVVSYDPNWSSEVTSYLSGAGVPASQLSSGYPCVAAGTTASPPSSPSFPPATRGNPITVSVQLNVPISLPVIQTITGPSVTVIGNSTMEML